MSVREALYICECCLDNGNISEEAKKTAIYTIMNMPTHMSVSKKVMISCIKWLYSRLY